MILAVGDLCHLSKKFIVRYAHLWAVEEVVLQFSVGINDVALAVTDEFKEALIFLINIYISLVNATYFKVSD